MSPSSRFLLSRQNCGADGRGDMMLSSNPLLCEITYFVGPVKVAKGQGQVREKGSKCEW